MVITLITLAVGKPEGITVAVSGSVAIGRSQPVLQRVARSEWCLADVLSGSAVPELVWNEPMTSRNTSGTERSQ